MIQFSRSGSAHSMDSETPAKTQPLPMDDTRGSCLATWEYAYYRKTRGDSAFVLSYREWVPYDIMHVVIVHGTRWRRHGKWMLWTFTLLQLSYLMPSNGETMSKSHYWLHDACTRQRSPPVSMATVTARLCGLHENNFHRQNGQNTAQHAITV